MTSRVDICNIALARLGGGRITSLTDETNSANLCDIFYEHVVRLVISSAEWTSTTKRQSLARLSDAPSFGYAYQYQLPTSPKCLNVIEINEEYVDAISFKIEGSVLLTDEPSVSIKYSALIEDENSYDPQLIECITNRMTAELALPITGQASTAQSWMDFYYKEMSRLLAVNNRQGSLDIVQNVDILRKR